MVYDPKELFARALVTIEENKLFFVEDVADMLGISKVTVYKYWPPESNELNAIKEGLTLNRIQLKVNLRARMARSDNPTDRMALYKLIGSEEERRRLSMHELKVSGSIDNAPGIDLGRLTRDQRQQWYELYNLAKLPIENTIDIDHEEINQKQITDGNN